MADALSLTPEEIADLPPDGGPRFNRLVFEKSPYLLQHAANPVDWYPWGDEAFEEAAVQDKPVFLSIGYSTCHWCHVMERESFEDPDVAALLNELFVPVKVDREERPDIDNIYMAVTQGVTGSGGWPMTLVLTPEGKPFFAGTYFPREGVRGRPGMLDLLPALAERWRNRRGDAMQSAEEIVRWLERHVSETRAAELDEGILDAAYRGLAERFDPSAGGFGSEPKFPTPHNLTFLLRYWKRTGMENALDMVEATLDGMRRGGLYDQIGYGFHRYSTDRRWLVPHFEKMLYDQALLADAYLQAFQVTGREDYAAVAGQVFEYVLRDMTDPGGGFYSAEDADSEEIEGKFYVWSYDEVEEVLGEAGELYLDVYGFERDGNYREEATGAASGMNIPHLRRQLEKAAGHYGVTAEELRADLEESRALLFETRRRRVHPYRDDKILTGWNGLMIASLARGGRILDEPGLTEAAAKAAGFIWTGMRDSGGMLLKSFRQGSAGRRAHLDDYAFYVRGLIELYEADFDPRHLRRAAELAEIMVELFYDEADGGFFFTSGETDRLPVRKKEVYDGALPSGNSVAAISLLRLGRMTARPDLEALGAGVLGAFGGQVELSPAGFTSLLEALDFLVGSATEIVIAGSPDSDDTIEMIRTVNRAYLPNSVLLFRPEDQERPDITALAPYTLDQRALGGRATAYVCRNYVCGRPTTSVEEMLESITKPEL